MLTAGPARQSEQCSLQPPGGVGPALVSGYHPSEVMWPRTTLYRSPSAHAACEIRHQRPVACIRIRFRNIAHVRNIITITIKPLASPAENSLVSLALMLFSLVTHPSCRHARARPAEAPPPPAPPAPASPATAAVAPPTRAPRSRRPKRSAPACIHECCVTEAGGRHPPL